MLTNLANLHYLNGWIWTEQIIQTRLLHKSVIEQYQNYNTGTVINININTIQNIIM